MPDDEERRKDMNQMALDIADTKKDTEYIVKAIDGLTVAVKEDRDKADKLGTRVTVLETNQKQLKSAARSDKFIDRIAIIASTVAGVFLGPRQ